MTTHPTRATHARTNDSDTDNRFLDPRRWAPRLDRALAAHERLYESLDQLSASQAALIEADDGPGLLRVLAERQEAITRLAASNEDLAPFRANWSDLMSRLAPDQRASFDARVAALTERVEAIAQRDEADQRALGERQARTTGQLAEIARSRSAVSAYGRPSARGPRFQDREV